MNKIAWVEHARTFLNDFLPYIDASISNWTVNYAVRLYNNTHNTDYYCNNGMSRICIIGEDFVVKLQFDGKTPWCGGNYAEYRFYREIMKSEYAYLFAEMHKIKVHNHYYYVMEKIDDVGRANDDEDIYDYINDKESDFLQEIGLSDLHNENFGFIDDSPVIIDYAYNNYANNGRE